MITFLLILNTLLQCKPFVDWIYRTAFCGQDVTNLVGMCIRTNNNPLSFFLHTIKKLLNTNGANVVRIVVVFQIVWSVNPFTWMAKMLLQELSKKLIYQNK